MTTQTKTNLPEDLLLFCKLAHQGVLYEFMRNELDLGPGTVGRNVAKEMMITTFFSKPNSRRINVMMFAKLFPTVLKIIKAYKLKHGHKAFAVLLQRKESEIFIDKIFNRLQSDRFICLSKHDSILCRSSDVEQILPIVTEILNEELGEHITSVVHYNEDWWIKNCHIATLLQF